MRLFQPPMRFWSIATIVATALAATLFWRIWETSEPGSTLRNDILATLFQFLLITVAGGIFLIFMNARRDEDRKDDAREIAVREMVDQIVTAYRKLKMVKRRLRSQMAVQDRGPDRTRELPYKIPAPAFEAAMEDLLAGQIEAEQVRDRVTSRPDLLSPERIERLRTALHYAARYFADVYEDFEDCVVSRSDDCYEITMDCRGLADFLGRARWKKPPSPPWSTAVQAQYEILKQNDASPEVRHAALCAIEELRKKDRSPRYRLIATQCINLASTDIYQALRRRRWLSLFAKGNGWLE